MTFPHPFLSCSWHYARRSYLAEYSHLSYFSQHLFLFLLVVLGIYMHFTLDSVCKLDGFVDTGLHSIFVQDKQMFPWLASTTKIAKKVTWWLGLYFYLKLGE
jgi:hypothetical protein